MSGPRAAALTLLALLAFAANSLLTRLALGSGQIGAAAFTAIRLVSGAVTLAVIARARSGTWATLRGGRAVGPLALFVYAAPFSFAYLRIGAAVGALVLFGVVQLTMVGYGISRGERPAVLAWCGILLAVGGLANLTLASASRPDPIGLALMAVAGAAWGVYTITGRGAGDPINANARSFLWSAPLALAVAFVTHSPTAATARGVTLALTSGAITSGLGYSIWYSALPSLTVTQAAVAQLSVPIIAALGASAVLGEKITARLVVASAMVLGGIAGVVGSRAKGQ